MNEHAKRDAAAVDDVHAVVRKRYAAAAKRSDQSCCGSASSSSTCCGDESLVQIGRTLGYSEDELAAVPEGANLGLGCGNPTAIAALKVGETVLDLGSGGGFDCFLAARQVGPSGRVIGVDMTPEMVAKARANARKGGFGNVEFRLGEIEHLPVADASVDAIISNCVINLAPDKRAVFAEAFRVLKPGGRLAISDIVATAPMPEEVRSDLALLAGCIAGAVLIDEYQTILRDLGYQDIDIRPREASRELIREWAPGRKIEEYVVSAAIEATK